MNRHPTDTLDTLFQLDGGQFSGSAEVSTVTGANLHDTNTLATPEAVTTTSRRLEIAAGSRHRLSVPPRSVTGLVFEL